MNAESFPLRSNEKRSEMNEADYDDEEFERIEYDILTSKDRVKTFFELGDFHNETIRKLKSRHMLMIAIGGAIGTGIFLSSGQAIATSGPGGAIAAYVIAGTFVMLVIMMLGEMCAAIPISGGYGSFGTRLGSKPLGFALGINYYLQWALTIPADAVAIAIIVQFWLPNFPSWLTAIIVILPIFFVQLLNVRVYGEVEYWAALLKASLIVIFIIIGLLYDWGAFPKAPQPTPGITNWKDGQAFFGGFVNFSRSLVYAFYSYSGAEMIALTSGEALAPSRSIPKAIRLTYVRMLLFNVLTVLVIGLCINSSDNRLLSSADSSDVSQSPLVIVFTNAGLPRAIVHVVNAIIFTAVLSALNSAFYASTRIVTTMSKLGIFPKFLGRVNRRGVPILAVMITLLISSITFLTTQWGAGVVFLWLQNVIAITAVIALICTSFLNIRFHQAIKAQGTTTQYLPLKLKFYPLVPILSVVMGIFFFVVQGYASAQAEGGKWKNLLGTYVGAILFVVCYFGYVAVKPNCRQIIPATECILVPNSVWDPETNAKLHENFLVENELVNEVQSKFKSAFRRLKKWTPAI